MFNKKLMRLSKIKISEEFEKTPPKKIKLLEKRAYQLIYNQYEQPIVVNKNNVLIDGYTTYLLMKADKKIFAIVEMEEDYGYTSRR